jgi:CheY-like chemotaxis protein
MMRLLLIDDDPLVGNVARRIAEKIGFEVIATTEAETFKAACQELRPEVISLDLFMPGCDGIELLRYLADIECRAQILIASGFDTKVLKSAHDLGATRGLNMAGIIAKPLRVAEVRTVLEDARAAILAA